MNERIKELMEQAGFIPGIMGLNRYTYFDPEKFAELIVRDAMDYASRNWEHGHLLAEDLKVYFGVK